MFTEILRIKPVLDSGSAKAMETSLSARFTRIAQRFGGGLKAIIKGSVLGISLGLLNRILNPIEALEEKIKSLLGQSTDINELADKLGTTPGQLKQLEDIAQSLGVKPEQFKELVTKYAQAIETARKEFDDPFAEKSAASQSLVGFKDDRNIAGSFVRFLQQLATESAGPGKAVFFGEALQQKDAERRRNGEKISQEELNDLIKHGLAKMLTGNESRREIEASVFGERLTGNAKRLVDTDLVKQAAKINEPAPEKLTETINRNATFEDQKAALEVQKNTQDFLAASSKLNEQMIQQIVASEARAAKRETDDLDRFNTLKKGADAVDDIQEGIHGLLNLVTSLLGELKTVTSFIPKISTSRWWNQLLKKE